MGENIMEIILTRVDVLEILAKHFGLPVTQPTTSKKSLFLARDEIYWEGNPKPEA